MPRRFLLAHASLVLLLAAGGCGANEAVVDGRTLAEWNAVLADGARPVAERRTAADALGRIAGQQPEAAVRALAAARAQDTDEEVRRRAVVALAAAKEAALGALEAALSDPSPRVVEAALVALGSLGAPALEAGHAIALLLRAEPSVAHQAALALGRMGPQVLDYVTPYLFRESAAVRTLAIDALLRAGSDNPAARTILLVVANDEDWNVRRRAVTALGPHAAEDSWTREVLERALGDVNPFVVAAAARAIGDAGPALAPLLPRLVPLLASEVGPVRAAAAEAVGRLGGNDPAAWEAVQQAVERETGAARVPLWLARWRLTRDAAPTVEGLRAVLRANDAQAAADAAAALAELGADAAPAVPELVALLAVRAARQRAVDALTAIGPRAAAARPALESLKKDPNDPFRQSVEKALRAIGASAPEQTR
jgi:HEAT repeat protein